jgi:hypothetical protein
MDRFSQPDKSWIILWITGSVSGWLLGVVINLVTRATARSDLWPFLILGICLGLIQWVVALRGLVNGIAWVFATAIASIFVVEAIAFAANHQLIPQVFEYYNPGCLSASCDAYTLYNTWISGSIVYGLIASLAAILPTGVVLLVYGTKLHIWIVGGILSSVAGVLAYIPFALIPGSSATYLYLVCIGPIVIAAVSAPFIRISLQKAPRQAS